MYTLFIASNLKNISENYYMRSHTFIYSQLYLRKNHRLKLKMCIKNGQIHTLVPECAYVPTNMITEPSLYKVKWKGYILISLIRNFPH